MNIEHFIAKKISFGSKKSFTSIIVKIAILAIALSLAIMIVANAIITGFSNQISEKIIAFWGDIHITDSNINRTFEQVPIPDAYNLMKEIDSIQNLKYEDTDKFFGITIESSRSFYSTKGGIKSVQGTILTPGLLRTANYFNGILLKGVGKEFDWNRLEKYIVDGKILSFPKIGSSRDIIVSKSTAEKLKLSTGDRVNISFIKNQKHIKRQFKVCGIYNTGLEEYDSKIAIIDIDFLRELLGWQKNEVGNIEILVDNIEDVEVISEYIYYDLIPPNLYATTIQQKFPNIFEWLKLQEMNENIILALMIVVGIINMLSVLLILILERSKMIGILKALGSSNWLVRKVFLYNAGYIIFFGLLIGNIVGIGLCLLQQRYGFISLDEKSYYLAVAPIDLNLLPILLINAGTFFITLLVMVIPTILITYISPIKVLRFE
jgi:lipoprotein-releasing system permease protein